MKKTVKMLSVLALMLAIIVSCAPGPEATNNGSGSGVINPNIPPATKDDIESIIPSVPADGSAPTFSNKYLLVNASNEVQDSFATNLKNSDLFKSLFEGSEPTSYSYYVKDNQFVVKAVMGKETSTAYMVVYMKQNGNDGNWYYESLDHTDMKEDIYYVALSGQIMFPEKYVGIKSIPDGKIITSTFAHEKGKENLYKAQAAIECEQDAYNKFRKANGITEFNELKKQYVLNDEENNRYISSSYKNNIMTIDFATYPDTNNK